MKIVKQKCAEWTAAAKKLQQNQTGRDGRNDQRQCEKSFHQNFSVPAFARECPGKGEAEWQNAKRAQSADREREKNDVPLVKAEKAHCVMPKPKRRKI